MATAGVLAVNVVAKTAGFHASMTRAGGSVSRFSKSAQGGSSKLAMLKGGLLVAGAAAITLGAAVTKLAADAETTRVRFETLTGSAHNTAKILGELKQFAAATPFQFTELSDGAAKLLSFGVGVEDLQNRVKLLGDIAAGSGARFGDLSSIFGKMKSSGVVALGDLNQLGDRGIPILETLKTQLGLSGAELRKYVSAGKLGFPQVLAAMQEMTSNGGMFFGAMEKQSKTLAGSWSTLMDNLTDLGTAIGEILIPILTPLVQSFTSIVQNTRWLIAQAGLAAKAVPKTFEKIKKSVTATVKPIEKVNKQLDEMAKFKAEAKQIEMSVRTPDEMFKDRIGELNKLVAVGALSWDTYDRAVTSATMKLMEATKSQDEMNQSRQRLAGVAAVAKGSTEAFSLSRQRTVQKETLTEQKTQTKLLERIAKSQEEAGVKKGLGQITLRTINL